MSVSRPLDGINRLPLSQSGDVSFDSRANSTPSDVALFVDWENLKASLNKVEKEPNVSSLRDIAEQFGRVVIASAFADWQDPWHQNDPGHLYSAGIEPVYVPTTIRHGSGGRSSPWARRRNSVDVKITADCIECCFKYPNVKTFVLVSGDGDFVHLVNTLRPYGRSVVAVGVSWSTSVQLAESVDQLLYYDRDIEPIELPAADAARRQFSEEDEQSLSRAFERAVAIIHTSQHGDRALLSWIKHEMIKRHGPFNEKQWGFPQFKGFMREAEARGLVQIVERDLVNWAYLPGAVKPGDSGAGGRQSRMGAKIATAGRYTADGRPKEINAIHERLIRFAHDMEMRYPYVSFTFLRDRLLEAELFSYNPQETSDLLNEAVEDTIFLHSSVQDSRSGTVRTIRTITLNHNHPEVARALGDAPPPAQEPAAPTNHESGRVLPGLMKPGGDSRLAEDLRALADDPDNAELEFRVGDRLRDLDRYAEALEHLRRAVELAPKEVGHRHTLVRTLTDSNQIDDALLACEEAAHEFADDSRMHQLLGQLLVRDGNYERALHAYGRAMELLPDGAEGREQIWLDMIDVHLNMERPDSALEALKSGLAELPESERLAEMMRRLQEDDRRAEAEALGRQATSMVSQLGKEDEVISLAEQALKLSEAVYQPFYALGEIYMRSGKLEEAANCFERAIPACPNPGAIYSMRMRLVGLYERLGRNEAADEVRSLLG